MDDRIGDATAERVLERLGFTDRPAPTLDGLRHLYRAWCRAVPFDNVRKRIALAAPDPAPLPGGAAEEFFAAWRRHGTGGTCWPSSNGLFTLLAACGFDARRIEGSMREMPEPNHGSVIVRIDGAEWLADSSMLTEAPIPLHADAPLEIADPLHPIRVEPLEDGALRVHWAVPFQRDPTFPCRIRSAPVAHSFYLERYEITRSPDRSPFNAALYAARNVEGGVLAYLGRTQVRKRHDSIEERELEPAELARSLVEELGLSEEIVADLAKRELLG
jgi:N-hydroxyarylamine O-acetyltransferase